MAGQSNPAAESDVAAKARRRRSIALALGLTAFVIIVFIVTIVKLKGSVFDGSHL